jgi:hypothetical protein
MLFHQSSLLHYQTICGLGGRGPLSRRQIPHAENHHRLHERPSEQQPPVLAIPNESKTGYDHSCAVLILMGIASLSRGERITAV